MALISNTPEQEVFNIMGIKLNPTEHFTIKTVMYNNNP